MKPFSNLNRALPPEVHTRLGQLRVHGHLPDPAAVRHILVRAPNWVGDAVMALPVLSGLCSRFPGARLTVLAAPRVAPLFHGQPGVAQIVPYPAGRGKWQVLWGLRKRFDLALALPNSLESALGLWLVGVPARAGYNADARRPLLTLAVSGRHHLKGLHTVYYFLGLLRAFGDLPPFAPPRLFLDAGESEEAAAFLETSRPGRGPWVGLAPGAAYGPAKRWPPERFAALATALQEAGARLVLLGGPQDRDAASQITRLLQVPVLNLVGCTNLRQALGVLSRLQLLITNDSGLMHAAAALEVPLVALFGSTDPLATGPFTDKATVLHHPLACSPCLKRTCAEGYPCLTAISVEEARNAVIARLEGRP